MSWSVPDLRRSPPDQFGQTLELFRRQIAQFDGEPDNAWNHIRDVGVTSNLPTVPTCRPGSEVTRSRTAIVRCDAASSASCRSAIAVEPA